MTIAAPVYENKGGFSKRMSWWFWSCAFFWLDHARYRPAVRRETERRREVGRRSGQRRAL